MTTLDRCPVPPYSAYHHKHRCRALIYSPHILDLDILLLIVVVRTLWSLNLVNTEEIQPDILAIKPFSRTRRLTQSLPVDLVRVAGLFDFNWPFYIPTKIFDGLAGFPDMRNRSVTYLGIVGII
jgi:hypothetical protein